MNTSGHHTARPSAPYDVLAELIDQQQVSIGIVGLGYVGLPLAHSFVSKGLPVVGFDVDETKITHLTEGVPYIDHLGEPLFATLRDAPNFEATTDLQRLAEVDAVLVAVPTPLGDHNEPDLSFVEMAGQAIGEALRPGQLIVLESTTYPGTTRNEFASAIHNAIPGKREYQVGLDVFIAYSPEREDPGNALDSRRIPKLVGGLDPASGQLASALYSIAVDDVVPLSNAEIAESAKLLENIFRAVNIALVNEMKVVLTELGIDIWAVIEAASTKPFGFMPFYPGPGLGGHCIPIDPFYMTWKAKEVDRPVQFIEVAGLVNERMPRYVVERVTGALNTMAKAVNGSRILVLGLAYKPNVSDCRESPALAIMNQLGALGADVDYSDPYIAEAPSDRGKTINRKSVVLTPERIASYDAVIIATNHDAFDYQLLADAAAIIVDTRHAMSNRRVKGLLVDA